MFICHKGCSLVSFAHYVPLYKNYKTRSIIRPVSPVSFFRFSIANWFFFDLSHFETLFFFFFFFLYPSICLPLPFLYYSFVLVLLALQLVCT